MTYRDDWLLWTRGKPGPKRNAAIQRLLYHDYEEEMTTTTDAQAQVRQATEYSKCEWQAWLTYYRLKWHRWRGQYEEAYQDARLLLALMTKMDKLRREAQ